MIGTLYESYPFLLLMIITEGVMLYYSYKKFKGDVLSPSVLTLIFFFISTFCFACNVNNWIVEFTFKSYALFTCSFLIMIGVESYYFNRKTVDPEVANQEHHPIGVRFEYILFLLFSALSFLYVYRVYKSGMALGATSLLATIGFNKEEGDFDGISRLFYNLVRMASYVYGVIFCYNVFTCRERLKDNWKSLLIIIFTVGNTFFSGQRSACICYIIGFLATAKICIYYRDSESIRQTMGKFKKYLFIFSGGILFLFFVSASTVKGRDIDTAFTDYVTYYFGSVTALMGRIVEHPQLCHTPFVGYFGEKTFNGFWMSMYQSGYVDREPCDREWINMGDPNNPISAGNEYTFFCAPYIDFGFWGTLIFMLIFFWVYSSIYYKKIYGHQMNVSLISTIAIYIFLYAMVPMDFYQDTIRSYSRPINLLYLIYIYFFCKTCLFVKRPIYID